jgi:hypothetical protein
MHGRKQWASPEPELTMKILIGIDGSMDTDMLTRGGSLPVRKALAQALALLLLAALSGVLLGGACAWLDGFYHGCLQYVLPRYLP